MLAPAQAAVAEFMSPTLAIVIPIGPGENAWHGLMPYLENVPAKEIALVLSSDRPGDPIPLSNERLLMVVSSSGRAKQLNAGAYATESDWLWFLHADSRFDTDTLHALSEFICGNAQSLGYFNLGFLKDGPACMAINALGTKFRSRWLGIPFGDQGFLMSRRVFNALGGFDESLSNGEDHAMVFKARKLGVPLCALPATLFTSARKYAQHGWWKTTIKHLQITWQQARNFSKMEIAR